MLRNRLIGFLFIASVFALLGFTNDSFNFPSNFHKVSEELFRSAQPRHSNIDDLEKSGIKSLLNLRNRRTDKHKIKGSSIQEYRVQMRASKIDYEDMLHAFQAFEKAEKPVLVHCRRGSDRTGCFVALYNIMYLHKSKEEAIEILLDKDLGYKHDLFPNIEEFVQNLDIEKMKNDLGIN